MPVYLVKDVVAHLVAVVPSCRDHLQKAIRDAQVKTASNLFSGDLPPGLKEEDRAAILRFLDAARNISNSTVQLNWIKAGEDHSNGRKAWVAWWRKANNMARLHKLVEDQMGDSHPRIIIQKEDLDHWPSNTSTFSAQAVNAVGAALFGPAILTRSKEVRSEYRQDVQWVVDREFDRLKKAYATRRKLVEPKIAHLNDILSSECLFVYLQRALTRAAPMQRSTSGIP